MDRQKGIAYCGLACAVCSENTQCTGCRNDGCIEKEWCFNLKCCRSKQLNGCWECENFPCSGNMLDKVRVRAFASFVKRYGEETLLNCLEKNEHSGIVYHHPGKLTGDYDVPQTEEGIIHMILTGKPDGTSQEQDVKCTE
jgi:hypothetical protein